MKFEVINLKFEDVRKHIQDCEGKHKQQVAFSTFHDALTQICFGCKKIRTSINFQDREKEEAKADLYRKYEYDEDKYDNDIAGELQECFCN